MSGKGYIAPEKSQQCDLCGVIAELRPYGPNGECVCFPCGMKDPVAATQRFLKGVFGLDVDREEVDRLEEEIRRLDEPEEG